MNSLATMLSSMSEIDSILDDLKEELGDLPQQVKEAEEYVRLKTTQAEQSEKDIHDIEEFKSRSHIRLQEIKDKEDQLAQQQFNVRNNKEFDAITHEIESLRDERNKIYDDQRTIGVKEENLRAIMEQSKTELAEAQQHLSEKEQELTSISHGHNDEILEQTKKRASLAKEIPTAIFAEYERIRTFHKDAAVKVKKNSCSGCFSAVPPQKIVEMRNKSDLMFLCEHCGRILVGE
ncbi:MAG: zinc ribbon domain-containing protein [Candidatus Kapaibacteriota bacterium]|jgi:predicted  nucleic acid-binding Zn-ribbon protein